MTTIFRAALVYFALVLGAGFVMGMIRIPILVPRIGERWAELAEMPIMAAVIYGAARYILRRFPGVASEGRALAAGWLALAMTVAAELGMAVLLQEQTLSAYIRGRDKVSGAVYVALLLVFAVMPRLLLMRPPPARREPGA